MLLLFQFSKPSFHFFRKVKGILGNDIYLISNKLERIIILPSRAIRCIFVKTHQLMATYFYPAHNLTVKFSISELTKITTHHIRFGEIKKLNFFFQRMNIFIFQKIVCVLRDINAIPSPWGFCYTNTRSRRYLYLILRWLWFVTLPWIPDLKQENIIFTSRATWYTEWLLRLALRFHTYQQTKEKCKISIIHRRIKIVEDANRIFFVLEGSPFEYSLR